MAKVIMSNTEREAVVKFTGATATLTLAELALQGVTPSQVRIKSLDWCIAGANTISVTRNSVDVVVLSRAGKRDYSPVLEENPTHDITLTVSGGTAHYLIISLSKVS